MKKQESINEPNRLINEASPYLLQHAYNPVQWYPWCDEAFKEARKQDKPIFLSVGYSTCHWCHVMAKESFSNNEIARLLNDNFISIKVDREERPDIDSVYMKAIQIINGSGGWPMSVFLDHDGKPFYGGTYFPPADRYSLPGFNTVLEAVTKAWQDDRDELLTSADKISAYIASIQKTSGKQLTLEMQDKAVRSLTGIYDHVFGGFGSSPKFPQPSILKMLLGYWARTKDPGLLEMVENTLKQMANGGIYDHLGGGFCRYSTDARWLVPHFEKMLYDQALLGRIYIHACQVTANQYYANIAREIFDYVLGDMPDPQGGFFSAEDADTEGKEGAFYTWSKAGIEEILGEDDARLFNVYYGITRQGNFKGENILHVTKTIKELSEEYAVKEADINHSIAQSRKKLLAARNLRRRPHRDDKIITGWNGLMISSLATGGAVLGDECYLKAAENAADFILKKLCTKNRLKRYYAGGKAHGLAVLDDYAFFIMALIDLYQADFNTERLLQAARLAGQMIELFGDKTDGGFYFTGSDAEKLIAREKSARDGAIDSGNSAASHALLKLGRITMNNYFIEQGQKTLEAFSGDLLESGANHAAMISALDYYIGPGQEIVVAGEVEAEDTSKMLRLIRGKFLPRTVLLFHPEGPQAKDIEKIADFVKLQKATDGKATVYVCQNYVCRLPVTAPGRLDKLFEEL